MRLDQYIVTKGFTTTRARAQDAIQQGRVSVNTITILKNSFQVNEADKVILCEAQVALASRAGYKLFDVLDDFGIELKERICVDVGASTGGFSDVCIKQGAALVYALDVGKDQLLPTLKENPRIINREGVNCRFLNAKMFDPLPDFACMDVSFISIQCILPVLMEVLAKKEAVVLIKPQFEAGKQALNKHGVVKEDKIQLQVLQNSIRFVESLGYFVHHLQASSLLGRNGNKEYVMHIKDVPCRKQFPLMQIIKEYHSKR